MPAFFDVTAVAAANPDFAIALAKGEPWAMKHAERLRSLAAGEPESHRREFTGERKKWCGAACSSRKGCVTCILEDNPRVARSMREQGYDDD
ncbi:MAG TPA: hypothetical protein VHC20_00895 [Candidatus Paceibacterota bacterium]|nr:hypothetical protein [Candidatus Paceibacterota bacterium]